jgi:NADH:ubiquinone oxidoreductase subunit
LKQAAKTSNRAPMGILAKIFTWWDGATIGTHLWAKRSGAEQVGTDGAGNKYFRARPHHKGAANGSYTSRERRWVIYVGANDASRVPSEWHGWLHGTYDDVPESHLPPPKVWEVDYTPNATGTPAAYLPQGALERGGKRASAVGDYEPWSPGSEG